MNDAEPEHLGLWADSDPLPRFLVGDAGVRMWWDEHYFTVLTPLAHDLFVVGQFIEKPPVIVAGTVPVGDFNFLFDYSHGTVVFGHSSSSSSK